MGRPKPSLNLRGWATQGAPLGPSEVSYRRRHPRGSSTEGDDLCQGTLIVKSSDLIFSAAPESYYSDRRRLAR